MHLADNGIAADIAELCCDLARRSPASQSFFNCSTRLWGQVKTAISPLPRIAADNSWSRAAMPSFKKTAPSGSLKARRAQKTRPNFYTGYLGREDWTCRAMSSDKLV